MPKNLTSLQAIRARCLDCCGFQPKEVTLCPCTDCPLHSRRFGKNPKEKREISEAQRIALEKGRQKLALDKIKEKNGGENE